MENNSYYEQVLDFLTYEKGRLKLSKKTKLDKNKFNNKKNMSKKKWGLKTGFIFGIMFIALTFLAVNFVYQIYRNPAEVVGIFNLGQPKTLKQTWGNYKDDFREHATTIIPPVYLAALAQTESAGNPFVTQSWKVKFSGGWKGLFSPVSSAVGLFQLTRGTFQRMSQYCVKNGRSVKDGPWHKWQSCWFNQFYSRLIPSHSIEMTSAFLHAQVLRLTGNKPMSPRRLKRLASIIHLCGDNKAKQYLRSGFRHLKRCGSHSVKNYVLKVERMENRLVRSL